jgi:HK97 family phage major capsid protein
VDILNTLVEERNRAHKAGLDITLAAASEGRSLTAEERESVARTDADYNAKQELIENLRSAEKRTRQAEAEMERNEELRATAPADSQPVEDVAAILRSLAKGERRSHTFEARTNVKGTTTEGGFTIPQGFGGRVIEKMLTVGPVLDPSIVNLIRTDSLQDIPFPVENARAHGTAIAEEATYAVATPTFTQKTLRAWKYGTLVVASEELLASEDVDLTEYFARSMGVGVGTAVNAVITASGTGTTQPESVATGAGSAVTGGTGVSGVPTYANLVDLVHSVDSMYARNGAFMMRRSTLGAIRKLVDSTGQPIFVPAVNAAAPSTVLGYNVVENPDVAATGTNALSVYFGDWSYLYVRQAGGIDVKVDTSAYFTSDMVAFKVRTWVDSFVGQSEAIKYFKGGTA